VKTEGNGFSNICQMEKRHIFTHTSMVDSKHKTGHEVNNVLVWCFCGLFISI